MKKTLSLSKATIRALEDISQDQEVTQSSIVETAIRSYLRWMRYRPDTSPDKEKPLKGQTTIEDFAR